MTQAISLIVHLGVSFGLAWATSQSAVFAPVREWLIKLVKRYIPEKNPWHGILIVLFGCPECQSFWYGALLNPLAGRALADLVSAPLRPLICGLMAFGFTVIICRNMKNPRGPG